MVRRKREPWYKVRKFYPGRSGGEFVVKGRMQGGVKFTGQIPGMHPHPTYSPGYGIYTGGSSVMMFAEVYSYGVF